jgi:hypothetical protein
LTSTRSLSGSAGHQDGDARHHAEHRERPVCHAWAPEDLALLIEPPLFDLARRQGEEIVRQGLAHAEPFAGPGTTRELLAGLADGACRRPVTGWHGRYGRAR